MKPNTAEAVPATAPSGSMDSEFMFDAAQPKLNMMMDSSARNSQSGRKPLRAKASQTALKPVKTSTAPCDRRRMPRRRTIRELVKDEIAISPATAAKASGK
jgi:hypothetical protein